MFRKTKPVKKSTAPTDQRSAASLEPLEKRTLLSITPAITIQPDIKLSSAASGSSSIQGYTPAQIRAAYGFTGISGDGTGQTIAIVDAYNDPNIAADLNVFDTQFGLSSANLSIVSQSGGSTRGIATDSGWGGEISLDVEWAHAIAPGAKILLVEANSASLSNLLSAVNYARNAAGVSVVSMSWGGSEFTGQTKYDNYFSTPAGHQGVTFVASAGDSTAAAAEWPAASPNVLSVGGTTLYTTNSGAYAGESAWNSSGGGFSTVESQPAYQNGVQNTGARSTPDVAYNADPNSGFAVYDSLNDQGYVGWQEVGGTSAGAPQWAALIAIADQARVANGEGTLDGPTGTLPTLYKVYSNASYSSVFNDVTTGVSGQYFGGGGRFGRGGGQFIGQAATVGYDAVTGLGTPQAAAVVSALEGLSARAAARALHAAHMARKLNRASGAHGTANPGIALLSTPSSSSSSSLVSNTTEGIDAATRVQLDAASAGIAARGDLGSAVFSTAPTAGISVVSESSLEQGPSIVAGMPRFAGTFAVSEAQSMTQAVVDWTTGAPSAALAMKQALFPAAQFATGHLSAEPTAAQFAAVAAQITGADVELTPMTPPIAFADATASFAEECASVLAATPSRNGAGPWAVAAMVLGLNGVLVGYWASKRRAQCAAAEPEPDELT